MPVAKVSCRSSPARLAVPMNATSSLSLAALIGASAAHAPPELTQNPAPASAAEALMKSRRVGAADERVGRRRDIGHSSEGRTNDVGTSLRWLLKVSLPVEVRNP